MALPRYSSSRMKALVITEHGPPDVLRVQERPDPEPGPGEVRIRVRAAGVNFADLLGRVGLYPDAPKPPCVRRLRGGGGRGRVGDGVEGLEVGQRVMGACRFGGLRAARGGATRARCSRCPTAGATARARRMPVTYATAYAGLLRFGGLRAGERVLIQAAAGGVGIAATQIAKLVGRGGVRHRPPARSTTRSAASGWTTRSTTAPTTWSTRCAAFPGSASRSTSPSTRSAGAASGRASRCCAPGAGSSASAPPRSRPASAAARCGRCG